MTTFRQISGQLVKSYTTNPDNPLEGQMWYNQTTLKLRGVAAAGAWSSASPMGTPRKESIGFGTQTAGVYCGGVAPPQTNIVEEYNGTGFTAGTNMPANRGVGVGAGTATAGLISNGEPIPSVATIEYDGSAWTSGGAMPAARRFITGFGLQTAAIGAGGLNGSVSNNSYEYNGSSWTALPNLNTARRGAGGTGSTAAGIVYGGYTTTYVANSEEWDGSSWSEGNDLNTARSALYSFGTQTTAVGAGGQNTPGYLTATENYDGSSWTTSPATMGTANAFGGSAIQAPGTAGISVGGNNPSINGITQEYNLSAQVIIPAAWASGGNMNTSRAGLTGFGTQTAAIAANGDTFPPTSGRFTNAAEEYNGATWTNIASTNTSTSFAGSSKLSPGSAGSVYGGEPVAARHEYWDGSTWSEQTDMNTPRYASGGAGTQTSSLAMAGIGDTDGTEEWDGSSWTTVANIPFATYQTPGAGSQTAAIIFGGNGPSGLNTTAEYNSGTWTAGGNLISPKTNQGGAGTQTAALSFMGATPTTAAPFSVTTEGYDGTAWSTRPSASTARRTLGSAGTSTAALGFGGYTPPKTAATEEFTPESTAVNVVDITTAE